MPQTPTERVVRWPRMRRPTDFAKIGHQPLGCRYLSGIRKVRIGGEGTGKSGGFLVIYLDLPSLGRIYLLTIYGKKKNRPDQ